MKTALVLCFLLAVAAAAPQGGRRPFNRRPGGFNRPNQFQQFRQPGQATGQAGANVVSANNNTPFGQTSINSLSANAGGQVIGTGSNQSGASASNVNAQTPFGNFQNSQTNAFANQQGGRPCFGRFCRGK